MAANGSSTISPSIVPEFIVERSETLASNPADTSNPTDTSAIERARMIEELQVPFDAFLVRWRAFETQWRGGTLYGLCFPYVDPRGYEDRLNQVCKPHGWSHQSQPSVSGGKVVVSCVVNIDGLGSHCKLGEESASQENAATAAEAQAFKRACACFGLGRYLYNFAGVWLPLNTEKRPVNPPPLPEFATPEGWRRGLRPQIEPAAAPVASTSGPPIPTSSHSRISSEPRFPSGGNPARNLKNVVNEIRSMRSVIGTRFYRALLKSIARAWQPSDIRDLALQRRVLEHMQGAERGLERLRAARSIVGNKILQRVLAGLELNSVADIHDLRTLETVVLALEAQVPSKQR